MHVDVSYGEATIGETIIEGDVLVAWDGSYAMRSKQHRITIEHLVAILQTYPLCDTFILGIGLNGSVVIEERAKELLEHKHIEFYIEQTKKAAAIFNAFAKEKKVVALLHTTL
ncbi:MAG: hypothetical protein KKA90_03755 [Nanoarchaeota archaeon]|nr:hypothetical protein [Nanoarchaeota archaeon]